MSNMIKEVPGASKYYLTFAIDSKGDYALVSDDDAFKTYEREVELHVAKIIELMEERIVKLQNQLEAAMKLAGG